MKKILVIGANGFLGKTILRISKESGNIYQDFKFIAADIDNINIPPEIPFYYIDITKSEDSLKKIENISPDVILLTAAMTDVDACEIEKDLATKVNTEGPKNIIKACKKTNSKLLFISTDFIFDGKKEKGAYKETDLPNPLSHYGKTKYEAELAILHSELDFLICRIAVLYGWNKEKLNFITWILSKLKQEEEISIVTTQINSPTYVINLSKILLELIKKDAQGIYHTAGDCVLNRYEIALICAEIFNYNKTLIKPIKYFKQRAIRPKNGGLNREKLKRLIGNELKIFNLNDGLIHMRENLKE